jgi:hypothetical protein
VIRKEEIYAQQLYLELQNNFHGPQNVITKILRLKKNNEPKSDIKISIEGTGVHWHCKVSKGLRQSIIDCFDIDFTNLEYKGPEYATSFEANGHNEASGRTFDMNMTIEAVTIWLKGKTVEQLYSKFSFIEEKKRQLEGIKRDIIKSNPTIFDCSVKDVIEDNFSSYSLWVKKENRSCRIFYYGYELNPRYLFNWDDSLIFETSSSETDRMGLLIKRWVVDNAMPSFLRNEFPEIKFGKLAKYYEQGNGVEGEFTMSWDSIEQFYNEIGLEKKDEILNLIKQMRSNGFDKTLRAGQSLFTLILSRSRRHGLKETQNSISFDFIYIKSAMEINMQKREKLVFDKIEYTDAVDRLLRSLEQEPID